MVGLFLIFRLFGDHRFPQVEESNGDRKRDGGMKILNIFFKHQAGALIGRFLASQTGQEQDPGVDFLLFIADLKPD